MIKQVIVTLGLCLGLVFSNTLLAQGSAQSSLPEGAGKMLVENLCSSCHSTATITQGAGFGSALEWRQLFSTMIELPDAQANTIAAYLAEHYPEDTSRRPNLIAGDVQIEIIEWTVPTLGQRVRDPIEAPDGSIWWTGMWASLTGRLDPETGVMEEFRLPPSSRPIPLFQMTAATSGIRGIATPLLANSTRRPALLRSSRLRQEIHTRRHFIPMGISISPPRAQACWGG
jgi:hypothetical protein